MGKVGEGGRGGMTREEKIKAIRYMLQRYGGTDNFNRAKFAFGKCSQAEMQQQYGQSGRTKQQILDEYKEQADNQKELRDFFEDLIKPKLQADRVYPGGIGASLQGGEHER